MEIDNINLIFERAFSNEALSLFDCGIREIDQLIHKKANGLNDFLKDNDYESFICYHEDLPVAVFVYHADRFQTEGGDIDAIEIDFIAVRQNYQRKGIGTIIINKIAENAAQNNIHIVKAGAFYNKRYSAEPFYGKCKFEQYSEKNANIIPMFKEI